MEQQKHRPWRRWVVLVLMIVGFILGGIFVPVQPEITAAPEKLIEEPLFTLPVIGDFYLVNTLPTLAVTVFIVIPLLAYFTNRSLTKSAQTDLVPRGIGNLMESILEILYNMTEGAAGKWVKVIFPWFATIMIYVLLANLLKLIPGFESIGVLHEAHGEGGHHIEPLFGNWSLFTHEEGEYILAPFFRGISVDLNFTVALALVAVVAVQVVGFRALGAGYLTKFFNFGNIFKKPVFGVIDMFMGLLELVSELSRVLSFAFRLFGNMFAGIVLVAVVGSLLGRFSIVPAMIFMFELFVGVIQAFVFGILTMVFMVMATQGHGEEHAEH
ncbi:MAG TPA: F0F1 ATP synthase subunit A [Anaerolineales bacterium]|nr:F0F1 ATP synthase subunit A [Anaerolineales bacterium]